MHHPIHLNIEATELATLRDQYAVLLKSLENGLPITPVLMSNLQTSMSETLQAQEGFTAIAEDTTKHRTVHLMHTDSFVLNLPWRIAVAQDDYLTLTKGLKHEGKLPAYEPENPLPLKVLVMIAAPEGGGARLSYEEEEEQIIRAFGQLYENAQVQIDFTDDGSIESLESRLRDNHYHILHFSGHGTFKDGQGYLQLEDFVTDNPKLVTAEAFAKAVNVRPKHRPALVMLSACQSAQGGSTEEGFKGVTDQMLHIGIPAVVAMSFSVLDYFATAFAAEFYGKMAAQHYIGEAFHKAVQHIRILEQDWRKSRGETQAPGQWMIPQLYTTQQCTHLINWQKTARQLRLQNYKFATGDERLILEKQEGYRFIGRRKKRKEAMQYLRKREPILIKGQGGVGKTSFAEHLTSRLITSVPDTQHFVFNQNIGKLNNFINTIASYLDEKKEEYDIHDELLARPEAKRKLNLVLKKLREHKCNVVFIFDNLECFQEEKGGHFKAEHADILMAMKTLQKRNFPLIFTGRYPLADFPDVAEIDLNQAGYNDFFRKCQQLQISQLREMIEQKRISGELLHQLPNERLTYEGIIGLLHMTFGGNYRALEFFDKLFETKQDGITTTLSKLADFKALLDENSNVVEEYMGQNIVFQELLDLLDDNAQCTLQLLTNFRVPVLEMAIRQQNISLQDGTSLVLKDVLKQLTDKTLIEKHQNIYDNNTQFDYFYVTPIVRTLLERADIPKVDFSHQKAGEYFEFIFKNISRNAINPETAYHHYSQIPNNDKVSQIGSILCQFYHNKQIFEMALFYAKETERILQGNVDTMLFNDIGLINIHFGNPDEAKKYFEKALNKAAETNDKLSEGIIYDNLGLLYNERHDYFKALEYFRRALDIFRQYQYKRHEITVISNITSVYITLEKYEEALEDLKIALDFHKKNGTKKEEAVVLDHLGIVYANTNRYDDAIKVTEDAIAIFKEIPDKKSHSIALCNLGRAYSDKGNYDHALNIFDKSLKMNQELDYHQGILSVTFNIASTHKKFKSYDKGVEYFERAIVLCKKSRNKLLESRALYNIGRIFFEKGDYIEATETLKESLLIQREISYQDGEARTLSALARIAIQNNDTKGAITYWITATAIYNSIGNKEGVSKTNQRIAEAYFGEKNYDKSIKHFKIVLSILNTIEDKSDLPMVLHRLSIVYCSSGDIHKYLEYEYQAMKAAKRFRDIECLYEANICLANIFCTNGKVEQGVKHYEEGIIAGRKLNDPGLVKIEKELAIYKKQIQYE